ncbi:MAG: hypothetical protein INQ03_19975 [Candidatus Heimdallarchaeota archaeon]|nr:hypothetical protein [Candidatus Heimdallarchaeota archaeon]
MTQEYGRRFEFNLTNLDIDIETPLLFRMNASIGSHITMIIYSESELFGEESSDGDTVYLTYSNKPFYSIIFDAMYPGTFTFLITVYEPIAGDKISNPIPVYQGQTFVTNTFYSKYVYMMLETNSSLMYSIRITGINDSTFNIVVYDLRYTYKERVVTDSSSNAHIEVEISGRISPAIIELQVDQFNYELIGNYSIEIISSTLRPGMTEDFPYKLQMGKSTDLVINDDGHTYAIIDIPEDTWYRFDFNRNSSTIIYFTLIMIGAFEGNFYLDTNGTYFHKGIGYKLRFYFKTYDVQSNLNITVTEDQPPAGWYSEIPKKLSIGENEEVIGDHSPRNYYYHESYYYFVASSQNQYKISITGSINPHPEVWFDDSSYSSLETFENGTFLVIPRNSIIFLKVISYNSQTFSISISILNTSYSIISSTSNASISYFNPLSLISSLLILHILRNLTVKRKEFLFR